MSDTFSPIGGSMPKRGMHLPGWTLEQMAEELLPPDEHGAAMQHVESCVQCAAELEGYRALFVALSDLPRFAPSPGFSDAVIARTRIAPEPGPVIGWLRGFMPRTRRGWALVTAAVVAPALPVLAAAIWLLTHPLLSATTLLEWVALQGRSAAQAAGLVLWRRASGVGIEGAARGMYQAVEGVPVVALTALVALLAIAIPLSVWALIRLVRAPMRNVQYANRSV